MKSGIYRIWNILNHKSYIGQSRNVHRRIREHIHLLNEGEHHSAKLQADYDYFGIGVFRFEILEYCEPHQLAKKEAEYIKKFDSIRNGYNIQVVSYKPVEPVEKQIEPVQKEEKQVELVQKKIERKDILVQNTQVQESKEIQQVQENKEIEAREEERLQKLVSKLIQIEGKGKKIQDIVESYISMIENGFDLTISEMAEYLRCSYAYVQKEIAPHVEHIVISSMIRQALLEHKEDSEWRELFTKRKLYSRQDFKKLLLQHTTLVKTRERYFLEDLPSEVYEQLMRKAKSDRKKAEEIFVRLAKEFLLHRNRGVSRNVPVQQIERLNELPQELISLKDLLEKDLLEKKAGIWFNYNVEVYRYIEKEGIPKLLIGSLVRYRLDDFKKKAVLTLPIGLGITKDELFRFVESRLQ